MTRRIAVVGGGVIGASIAWHLTLAEAGDIVLYERERLGAGTTWHSAGNITWSVGPDDAVFPTLDAIEAVARESGRDTGWLRTGRLFLAQNEAGLEKYAALADIGEARGIESRMLSPAEAARHHPLLDPAAIAGAWLNSLGGRVNPADLQPRRNFPAWLRC